MENRKFVGKLLLVDDEDIVLDAYRLMLEKNGFQVDPARDYTEARARLRAAEYDAVLTDVIMDEKGGIEVLKTSMKMQPSTPVVLITGAPTVQTASTALRLGAYDYICKPISSETLINIAERAVAMKKVRLEKARIESDIEKYREKLEKIASKGPTKPSPDERRWRMLLDNVSDAVVLTSRDGRILDINRAALDLFECSRDEMKARDIRELHADEEGFRRFNTAIEENRSVRDFAVTLRTKGGAFVRCLVTSLIVEDEDGRVEGCQTIIRRHRDKRREEKMGLLDVTGKANAGEELKLLDAVIRQSEDSIVITRTDGKIQYANPAFEKMTGYTRDEALGKDILDLHQGLRETGARRLFANGRADESTWQGVFTSKTKDGSGFEAETTISPIRWESGEILDFVSITKNVTRKKRLESIAEAANLMDNIGYIFSGIRHEIGNPLNSIKMTLTVLDKNLDRFSHEKIVEFLARALSEISRMEYLLRTLKNFNMREHLEIVDFHVPRFIDSFLSLVSEDFGQKGILIEKKIAPRVTVGRADPRALQQVMLNLLTNAADALEGATSPRITIGVDASQGLIRIRVADNGAGMSDEDKSNLFKPFHTSKPHGAGLGLVIVRKMLSKMNGSISVESRKNRGATVTILIPDGTGGA